MISFVFRKLFLFFIPLMVYSQLTLATPPALVDIAVLEMDNYDAVDGSQVEANLIALEMAVGDLVSKWQSKGYNKAVPDLILLPEFVAAGYYVPKFTTQTTPPIWLASEPSDSPCTPTPAYIQDHPHDNAHSALKHIHTVEALKYLAMTYNTALATTYLERVMESGKAEFYNRFVLVGKDGSVLSPMIRKIKSAATEAYSIKSDLRVDAIRAFKIPLTTSMSINIGVGICYENYHCEIANYLNKWEDGTSEHERVHVLLAPHSAPLNIDFPKVGKAYVDRLNIPVVALANKTGRGTTDSVSNPRNGIFNGESTIVYKSPSNEQPNVVSVPGITVTLFPNITPTITIGTRYVFGHDLPVTSNTVRGDFSMDNADVCPSTTTAPTRSLAPNHNPYLNFWTGLVEGTIRDYFGTLSGTVEQQFEEKEGTGELYYNAIPRGNNEDYWLNRNRNRSTLNCQP